MKVNLYFDNPSSGGEISMDRQVTFSGTEDKELSTEFSINSLRNIFPEQPDLRQDIVTLRSVGDGDAAK